MGSGAEPICDFVEPSDPSAIVKLFLSAIRFVTSSPGSKQDLQASAQEQLEYLLTEDEDSHLLLSNETVKSEAKQWTSTLFSRFVNLLDSIVAGAELFQPCLSDLLWASQILTKLESLDNFIASWVQLSPKMVKILDQPVHNDSSTETKLKVLEVTSKVLDAISNGNVILPTGQRSQMVRLWLPFTRSVKWSMDSKKSNEMLLKPDEELWQSLESSFVLVILTLPSTEQAVILSEWLESQFATYPDLTEAFEIWCYRSKVAKRRLGSVEIHNSSSGEAS